MPKVSDAHLAKNVINALEACRKAVQAAEAAGLDLPAEPETVGKFVLNYDDATFPIYISRTTYFEA